MKKLLLFVTATLALSVAAAVCAAPATAQATRTWVSGVGDTTDPCNRTAPCKTFAGGINGKLSGGGIVTGGIVSGGGGGIVAGGIVDRTTSQLDAVVSA